MSIRMSCLALLSILFAASAFPALSQQAPSSVDQIPVPDMHTAIANLALQAKPASTEFHNAIVTPGSSIATGAVPPDGTKTVPAVSVDSVIITFKPGISSSDVFDYVNSHKLSVINKFPIGGSIEVSADLRGYFVAHLSDKSANESLFRGMDSVNRDYTKDPRVLAATPNTVLHNQSVSASVGENNLEVATGLTSTPSPLVMQDDWGVEDIEADALWAMPGATDGVMFGILDVGFARHDDLTFLRFPPHSLAADHGNHAAGIACGHPSSSGGLRGVLPNCYIRAKVASMDGLGDATPSLQIFYMLSQVLTQLEDFIGSSEDVDTFSVSIGYNWQPNGTNIDPSDPESTEVRASVAVQGITIVPYLERAAKTGKIVFFAAGNDSLGLQTPEQAEYASPFNWAVKKARSAGILNGVTVEAHDRTGRRAGFSNVGGTISCPGVDIMSTVAYDGNHAVSASSYGLMSGTSMATPYCAAGLALFRLVRPTYTAEAALNCILASQSHSDSGAPMMRLKDALYACK